MVGNAANKNQIRFGTTDNGFKGAVEYNLASDEIDFYVGGIKRLSLDNSGNLNLNLNINLDGSNGTAFFGSHIITGGDPNNGDAVRMPR